MQLRLQTALIGFLVHGWAAIDDAFGEEDQRRDPNEETYNKIVMTSAGAHTSSSGTSGKMIFEGLASTLKHHHTVISNRCIPASSH